MIGNGADSFLPDIPSPLGDGVILVHIDCSRGICSGNPDEFEKLAKSTGMRIVSYIKASISRPDSCFFIGSGKVEEIKKIISKHNNISAVLFNNTLSPSQERNLGNKLCVPVVDRTGVILDIFAQRARTFEGKLQVELAQLEYLRTRLIRGWTHLERQKGGIGLRGPGETQLETDRRLLRIRIKYIQKRLEKVRQQRDQGSQSRKKASVPVVSIVGYTNAGKSTLFNHLTGAGVYTADQLFATLDPTFRKIKVPEVGGIVLTDTVGFISHLPHKLVESFRATLEETARSDMLLHIIDSQDSNQQDNIAQVYEVLEEIGAKDVPVLEVFNKIDGDGCIEPFIQYDDLGKPIKVWISAKKQKGIDLLLQAIAKKISGEMFVGQIVLQPSQGKTRALLYEIGAVKKENIGESGECYLNIQVSRHVFNQITHQQKLSQEKNNNK